MRHPLVLVPGLDGTGMMFHRQVPRLARRFAVTTVRLRDEAERMSELSRIWIAPCRLRRRVVSP